MASTASDNTPTDAQLADAVAASYRDEPRIAHLDATFLPSRDTTVALLDHLKRLLFPGFFGKRKIERAHLAEIAQHDVAEVRGMLEEQIDAALRYAENLEAEGQGDRCAECTARAKRIAATFLQRVPEIRRMLSLDVQAAFEGDPACRHTDEAVFCYPGVFAIMVHRVAHELFALQVPLIPRMMNEHAHSLTGIDIHPGATIGESFFIDHGTGVVIGETSIIGRNVKVYQSVTIGAPAAALSQSARGRKRHPTIEDDVVIYANATILGGETVIGAGSIIGGGVFLTASVPAGHFVYSTPQELKYRSAEKMRALAAATAERAGEAERG